jgi:hypothetical protein
MSYYERYIEKHGITTALENLVFSPKVNTTSGNRNIWMCARFFAALFHPMIHVAYGLEFGVPGLVVEGLNLLYSCVRIENLLQLQVLHGPRCTRSMPH